MAETDFTTITSNTLDDIIMFAGDSHTLYFDIYNHDGTPLDLTYATCSVAIIKYGDPSYKFRNMSGSPIIDGINNNRFYVIFSGSGLSGVYQQQVKIVDAHGKTHNPHQGKITIFPSIVSASIPSGVQVFDDGA